MDTKASLKSDTAPMAASGDMAHPLPQDADPEAVSFEATPFLLHEQTLLENILAGVETLSLVLDSQGRIVRFNAACERVSGYRADQVIGKLMWKVLLPPQEAAQSRASFAATCKDDSTTRSDSHWRTRSGEHRLIRWEQISLPGPDGRTAYVVATGIDITDREASEASLKHEMILINTLMQNLPNQIYFKDRQSRFIWANQTMARWFCEDNPDDLVDKTDFDYFANEHALQAYADEQCVMATGQIFHSEEQETRRGGLPDTLVLTSKLPLRDSEQNIIGTFGISIDITERKVAEAEQQMRTRLFTNLAEFTARVNATREPTQLADILADAMNQVVPSDVVAVVLLDHENRQYFVRSIRGLVPQEAVGVGVEVGQGIIGRAIAQKAIVFAQCESSTQLSPALHGYVPEGSFSAVGIPLLQEDIVLGAVLLAGYDQNTVFSSSEREVIHLLGAQASLALVNACLAEEVSSLAIHD